MAQKIIERPILRWLHQHQHEIEYLHSLHGNYSEVLFKTGEKNLISYSARQITAAAPVLVKLRKAHYCAPECIEKYQHLISRRQAAQLNQFSPKQPKQQ